ncbi:stage II sporulation protein P [Desulfolucanica intricata]|uniref:stage II sporulation protein P n=1 Tax=Desulfolucanica intricata TaxID=1285191 RepID=UPI00082C264F|nr:stage II sporulation protein P [Desulfolucanica intricata]
MNDRLSKFVTIFLVVGILISLQPVVAFGAQEGALHKVGHCMDIVDKSGRVISKISHLVVPGDEIITCDGEHYRVVQVGAKRAEVRYLGRDEDYLTWCSYFKSASIPVSTSEWKNRPVGIYHTHTDESYLPSDGRSSIPFNGGIYEVGEKLSNSVKQLGVKILYDRTPHDPHDNMAYVRSRRTAVNLMKKNPVALFDVHRDGIPDPNFYRDRISGKDVSRLRLVIGRQNPKKSANLDFAKRLMAYANEKHPKIVKEIFIGTGNYNQDLMATALLIEAGTYTNQKGNAEEGISLLAEAVPVVLGLTGQDKRSITGNESENSHWWVSILLIFAVALGAGGFILLNSENSGEVLSRLQKRASQTYKRIRRRS